MPSIKIMTFNVENMLVRYRFREWEKEGLATLLDIDSDIDRANLIRTHWNVLNDEIRLFTALSTNREDPDIICLQEVENMHALRAFRDRYLHRRVSDARRYRHAVLVESHDPRGIDVAVLSRFRIVSTTTNQELEWDIIYPDGVRAERVFRRDCLEVNVKKENKILPVFVCHFKSMSGGRDETKPIRRAEAEAVKQIIIERFNNRPERHDWVIVGDLNDYTETDGTPDSNHALGPLLENNFSVDLVKNIDDTLDRWTHYYATEDSYHQLDYILLSPSLAAKNQSVKPIIVRQGQPYRAERYEGERWPRVGYNRPKASDHCPVVVALNY